MVKFEVVSRFEGQEDLLLPKRKTQFSAGYDFVVAEDTIIPSWGNLWENVYHEFCGETPKDLDLQKWSNITKKLNSKLTLIPTGVKCLMEDDMSLELYIRSSTPLKNWLMLANGVGLVDADYYNNPDNEGEIFFQVINMSPYDLIVRKGDTIGQGVFRRYETVNDDDACGIRIGGFGSTGEAHG